MAVCAMARLTAEGAKGSASPPRQEMILLRESTATVSAKRNISWVPWLTSTRGSWKRSTLASISRRMRSQGRVQGGKGFVQEQELGPGRQTPGQGHALALAQRLEVRAFFKALSVVLAVA